MAEAKTTMERYRETLDQAHKNYGNNHYIRKVMGLKEQLYIEDIQDHEKEAE